MAYTQQSYMSCGTRPVFSDTEKSTVVVTWSVSGVNPVTGRSKFYFSSIKCRWNVEKIVYEHSINNILTRLIWSCNKNCIVKLLFFTVWLVTHYTVLTRRWYYFNGLKKTKFLYLSFHILRLWQYDGIRQPISYNCYKLMTYVTKRMFLHYTILLVRYNCF